MMEKNRNFKDNENGRVIGGLILIGVGAALLLRKMGFFMPDWLFSWPLILILVGIYIGFKSGFRNNSWYIIALIGCFFLVSDFMPSLRLQPLFWPIIIIGLGVLFIIRPKHHKWEHLDRDSGYTKWDSGSQESVDDPAKGITVDDNDVVNVRSVFSAVNKNIVSKNFKGGRISCVFGGAEIDLRQAEINGQAAIKLEMVFGGAKLKIPPHWAIRTEIDGVFHGIDDKRSFNPSASVNPDKVLILTGSAVFAGIEIKSY